MKKNLSKEELHQIRSKAAKKAAITRRKNAKANAKANTKVGKSKKANSIIPWLNLAILIALIIIVFILMWRDTRKFSAYVPPTDPTATTEQLVVPDPALFTPVPPTPTPFIVVPVVIPPATETPVAAEPTTDLFESPVTTTDIFNEDSSWLIAEPGVIGDSTTAWTIGQVDAPYYQNVPEAGFAYFSLGEGNITIDGVILSLKGEEGLNYLVVIRGRIDDGIVDSDLNETAVITDFVPGHTIWGYLPKGAYVSKDWFRQQLVASSTEGFTNCGATGCSHIKVVLFDIDSHLFQMFEISAEALDDWTLLESGTK